MLLQERDYRLYHDGEKEEDRLHHVMQGRDSATSLGLSDDAAYVKISTPTNSFNKKLRRSTFDLSSFNSLATSSSDSSSNCGSTPTRKASTPTRSTLRYRGRSSASDNPFLQEVAPTQSFAERGKREATNFSSREVREATREIVRTGDKPQRNIRLPSQQTAPGTRSTEDSQPGWLNSNIQYVLETIILGCIVVPFLELTIQVERYARFKFEGIQRSTDSLFDTLFAPSSSFEDEPVQFDGQACYSSSDAPVLEQYQQELLDRNDYLHGCSSEAVSCHSVSSSGEDEHGQEDGWGHFTDFQDELADEANFVPSCSVGLLHTRTTAAVTLPPSCVTGLETLDEEREEDDDSGEGWSF